MPRRGVTCWLALLATMVLLLDGRMSGEMQVSSPADFDVRGAVDVDGRALRYSYHFDRNALAGAVKLGDAIIALTRSGNLLRIDAATLTLTAQAVVPEGATAIARDDTGVVLVGMDDGQIAVVNPVTLDRTLVVRTGGPVRWLTRSNGLLVAVLGRGFVPPRPGESERTYERRSRSAWSAVAYRNGRLTTHRLPGRVEPNAFLLDGTTLWLGTDNGEFGGELLSLDLNSGRIRNQALESGVLGLVRTSDGRMLAYGGTVHFFVTRAFIAEVDGRRSRTAFDRENLTIDSETSRVASGTSYPTEPIDHMIEDPADGRFWVLAAHTIYRADDDFSNWSKAYELGGIFDSGRRMSIGNTATVTSILPGSSPGALFAISTREGIRRVSPAGEQHFFEPGQLEEPILDVWPTSIGTLFLPATRRSDRIWRLQNGDWSSTRMCPDEIAGALLGDATLVADDAPGVLAYCEGNVSPGMSALVRHGVDGRLTTVDSWRNGGSESPDVVVPGPAGQFFGIREFGDGTLNLRRDEAWRTVGTVSPMRDLRRLPGPESRPFVTLAAPEDDTSFVLRATDGAVLRLQARPDGTWFLEGVGRELTEVIDAVPDREESLLGATPRGVFRYFTRTGRYEELRPPGRDTILTIARDSTGSLWAAGDRLYVSPDEARTWHVVNVPMVSPTSVKRLRQDPASPGGMFLSLGDRGLVSIRDQRQ